jgi:hypothetical protein
MDADKPGSRAAVLRRSEGARFSSPSDDEVGGLQSAIRRERSEQSNSAAQLGAKLVSVPGGPAHLDQHLLHASESLVNVLQEADHGVWVTDV